MKERWFELMIGGIVIIHLVVGALAHLDLLWIDPEKARIKEMKERQNEEQYGKD